MDEFVEYLSESKKALATTDFSKANVHIVMGNESCDLDSMISALALAYFHNKQNLKTSKTTLVLPVLNILSVELLLRTENCFVLDELKIDKNSLIFRDTINLEEIQKHGLLKLSIVDHHVLRDKDKFLQSSVVEVFDHRPKDTKAMWDSSKTYVNVAEVGSCATLVANEILKRNPHVINESLGSLLYDVITFDTIGFNPEADKVKELDITVSKQLENIIEKKDAVKRYKELWQAHNDVSHLSPKQLLSKDLKFINGLPIPGLPMLVRNYLNLPNVENHIESFCDEVDFTTVIIMGLSVIDNEVYRDIGIFAKGDKSLQNELVTKLRDSEDFCLEECRVHVPNVVYFKQNNVKKSRKHLLPILKTVLEK
ncbi:hypothetical protein RN001_010226 [Aquatica leii]|uniref:DHHA2 domain-containing protein n=1 Tax=Aquatica leii TaxID=1421715 RepID=A0AAN7P0L6_9COLE|nr:hypothetical protein RN001_010226 [Aquatica leii]